jgi:DNA-binding NtrC family response regulator
MLTNLCVLVVGHDDDERELLEIFLRELGIYAVAVPTAAEAMKALRLVHVDAAIVCTGLAPSRDGMLLSCIRSAGHHFPAIALGASRTLDSASLARRAGFEAHLVQPVDVEVLELTLERIVAAARRPRPPVATASAAMNH